MSFNHVVTHVGVGNLVILIKKELNTHTSVVQEKCSTKTSYILGFEIHWKNHSCLNSQMEKGFLLLLQTAIKLFNIFFCSRSINPLKKITAEVIQKVADPQRKHYPKYYKWSCFHSILFNAVTIAVFMQKKNFQSVHPTCFIMFDHQYSCLAHSPSIILCSSMNFSLTK